MSEATWVEEAEKNSGLLTFLGVLPVGFGFIALAMPFIIGVAPGRSVVFRELAEPVAGVARH